MAGGLVKYRHLSRSSAHRRALLRNLVTSLIEHESIQTSWHKAKEAQRMAEKMITLGKKNSEASKRQATKFLFRAPEMMPKLFGPLRERYAERQGGYTRVLRIEPLKEDQAASAILELVDGPKDMRFALTAKTIASIRAKGHQINDMTAANIAKVTRYRGNADQELEEMVGKFEKLAQQGDEGISEEEGLKKRRVYPVNDRSR
ncbi:54S ribosomal protein L8, mitochondrial [Recurvomyces mirabilis]|nr:54S ribosomal protein L8, mitochondrial [Recurvomyces mirabilis]